MRISLALLLLTLSAAPSSAQESSHKTIEIPSSDGVTITADLYATHSPSEAPMVILFHQAEASRGEYREIAPILNRKNLNAIAVDLRSGSKMNGIINRTFVSAKRARKQTNYLDAYQDMVTALKYVNKKLSPLRIYVWGSSFSASLVLKLAAEHPKQIRAVFAFSPREYFRKEKFLKYAKRIRRPTFIASAKSEQHIWKALHDAIPTNTKVGFIPKGKGHHGARALWPKSKGQAEYWTAVDSFLARLNQQ